VLFALKGKEIEKWAISTQRKKGRGGTNKKKKRNILQYIQNV
jgi:hypothetical protein